MIQPHSLTKVPSQFLDPQQLPEPVLGAGCDQAYHTYCVNLSHIPEGTWYCPECSRDWQPPPGTDFGVAVPNSHRPARR